MIRYNKVLDIKFYVCNLISMIILSGNKEHEVYDPINN